MKTIKNVKISVLALTIALMSTVLLSSCTQSSGTTTDSGQQQTGSTVSSTGTDTDGDGMSDSIEKTYGTNPYTADTDGDGIIDKEDNQPVYTDNLITESSTIALPVTITDARVEDNATADHLEISMKNTGSEDLSSFDIYFTITDKVNGSQEAYYQKLDGLTVKAGETVTVHFDNGTDSNHYFGNMNGLYGTSANGLTFDIQLHNTGYAPLSFSIDKAEGTAEVAD